MKRVPKAMSYRALCAELGFDPKTSFVDVTPAGAVTFTVGKPDEIRQLYAAATRAGYRVSPELVAARLRA